MKTLIITDPCYIDGTDDIQQVKALTRSNAAHVMIEVPDTFLDTIRTDMDKREGKNDSWSNAFVFGPNFPTSDYELAGKHFNDAGMTCIVDRDNLTPLDWSQFCDVLSEDANRNYHPDYHYAFFGHTLGGDVGASVWVHKNAQGEVNGLIIDNNCLFPEDDEDDYNDDEYNDLDYQDEDEE